MELNFIALKVKDINRATEFYREFLGKEPVNETTRLVEFETDELRLGLYDPQQDCIEEEIVYGNNAEIGFEVNSLEEKLNNLPADAEIESRHEDEDHRWAILEIQKAIYWKFTN